MKDWLRALKVFLSSNHSATRSVARKVKGLFWSIIHYRWIVTIEQMLQAEQLQFVTLYQPYLYYMHRVESFVQHGEDLKKRLERIIEHYQTLNRLFSKKEIEQMLTEEGLILYVETLKEKEVKVILRHEHGMRHEGLLCLILEIEGETVYYLHLSFTQAGILIGGVQGAPRKIEDGKWFTKATSGLRPQNFMIFFILTWAKLLEIPAVYGINPLFHALLESERGKHIKFDYQAFWTSLGMSVEEQPWIKLPDSYPRKSLEDVVRKKRSQYRKRYQWMDDVNMALLENHWRI